MQASLVRKQLTFRDIFTSIPTFWRLIKTVCESILEAKSISREGSEISEAAEH